MIYLIIAVALGFTTRSMGQEKGRSGSFWWGFFLGIIGVIVVAMQKDLTIKQ
jgi:uncharacterized membrane protein YdcZ (DUF606 family)